MSSVEPSRQLRTMYPSLGAILLTASQDEPLLKTALDRSAFDSRGPPPTLAAPTRSPRSGSHHGVAYGLDELPHGMGLGDPRIGSVAEGHLADRLG